MVGVDSVEEFEENKLVTCSLVSSVVEVIALVVISIVIVSGVSVTFDGTVVLTASTAAPVVT